MTRIVTRLEELVSAAATSAFPDASARCVFSPIADYTLGDLGTDLLQRIASCLRVSPAAVSQRILPALSASEFGEFSVADDYLNITLSSAALLSAEVTPQVVAPRTIVVAPRRRDLDPVGYARVVAAASLQWFLGGSSGTLHSAAGALPPGAGWERFAPWFVETVSMTPLVQDPDSARMAEMLAPVATADVTIWVYPDFLSKQRFRDLTADIRSRVGERFTVQCPDRTAISGITERLELDSVTDDPAALAAVIIYLARPGPGFELDLGVPRYSERANLRESLRSTSQRLTRWGDLAGQASVSGVEFGPLERRALSRATFLPLFRARAAETGAVGEFLHVLEDAISCITQYLNDPGIRLALDRGAPGGITRSIIAGASRSTSDTINSCLPFQDLERAQP